MSLFLYLYLLLLFIPPFIPGQKGEGEWGKIEKITIYEFQSRNIY